MLTVSLKLFISNTTIKYVDSLLEVVYIKHNYQMEMNIASSDLA